MTDLSDLSPRQIAVASMVGRAWSTKRIACELGIGERRARVIISSLAFRIGADPALDERIQVALWWHVQIALTEAA